MAKSRRQLLDYLRNYWLVSAIQDGLLGAIQAKDESPVFGDIDIVQSIVSATEVEGQGTVLVGRCVARATHGSRVSQPAFNVIDRQ